MPRARFAPRRPVSGGSWSPAGGSGAPRRGSRSHERALPASATRDRPPFRRRFPVRLPARGAEQGCALRDPSFGGDGNRPGRAGRPRAGATGGVNRLELFAVEGLPEVRPGDDLGDMISSNANLKAADVLVVAQKVVAKSEGKLLALGSVAAREEATRIATPPLTPPHPHPAHVA